MLIKISCLFCHKHVNKYISANKKSRFCSRICKDTWQKSQTGDKTSQWKGERAKYFTKHQTIRRQYGSSNMCWHPDCKGISTFYEWANIDHKYNRNMDDWIMLCRKCHLKHDLDKFGTRKNNGWNWKKENK